MGSDFVSVLQLLFSTLWRFIFLAFLLSLFIALTLTSSVRAVVITIPFFLYKLLCRLLNEAGDVEAFVG